MSQHPKDPYEHLRPAFEKLVGRDSFGFAKSHKGNYKNPAIARDWRWFKQGAKVNAQVLDAAMQPSMADLVAIVEEFKTSVAILKDQVL